MSHDAEVDAHLLRDALVGVGSGAALVSPLLGVAWYCNDIMSLWALSVVHAFL
ncbi:MAG: hypothetical protein K0R27_1429 [Xanthobacteraceae bacterium]|jgi:hypothetical protein|nr:hypothetical protein [Xanthobacteraceae bacterium]